MKINFIKYLFLFSVFFSTACEDVINLNVPEGEKKLVVEGWIDDLPGNTSVKLTYSADYFSGVSNPSVNNATVIIITNNSAYDTLTESMAGIYESPVNGVVGNTYKLYIKTNNGEEYMSQPEELRSVPAIDSIYTEFREETLFDDEGYYVQINTYEPAGKGDAYRWKFYKNDSLVNAPEDLLIADDEFVDGNVINGFDVHFEPLKIGDSARVEQMSISRNAFEFFALVQEQTLFIGSIFDFPASPIQGNMYNLNNPDETVLGFFGASSIEVAEIVVQ